MGGSFAMPSQQGEAFGQLNFRKADRSSSDTCNAGTLGTRPWTSLTGMDLARGWTRHVCKRTLRSRSRRIPFGRNFLSIETTTRPCNEGSNTCRFPALSRDSCSIGSVPAERRASTRACSPSNDRIASLALHNRSISRISREGADYSESRSRQHSEPFSSQDAYECISRAPQGSYVACP